MSDVFHPDGLIAAKMVRTPGVCLFCDDPVARGKKFLCADKECERAYYRAWHRDQKLRTPERYGEAFYAEKGAVRPSRRSA